MVRFSPNLKKGLLIGTVILVSCDISMLFAAPASQSTNNAQSSNPQLQQLQAQIQAMQSQPQTNTNGSATTSTGSDAVGGNVANQIINSQKQTDNILPPSPFNEVQSQQPQQIQSAGTPQFTPPSQSAADLQTQQTQSNLAQQLQQQLVGQPSASQSRESAVVPQTSSAQNPIAESGSPYTQQITLPSETKNNQEGVALSTQATSQTTSIPSLEPAAAQTNSQLSSGASATATSAASQPSTSDSDISDVAFEAMLKNALPLTPDQIQKLRSTYMTSQFAASSSPVTPPRPTATSQFVDLSPGATPPVIRLAQGFITSLVFVDSTGAPWPIESYDVGNPTAFNIQWDKSSNTMMVQSQTLYNYGNLAIKLRDLDTPVMLTLIPGQKAVDYRVDLRVQGLGPQARPLPMSTMPASTSSDLLNVLDGVPPANSKALKVEGGDCQAWLSGSTMYVRTRLNVLSPGWIATLSSADGMHAYQMQSTPMLLVSQNGQVLQLKVEGF